MLEFSKVSFPQKSSCLSGDSKASRRLPQLCFAHYPNSRLSLLKIPSLVMWWTLDFLSGVGGGIFSELHEGTEWGGGRFGEREPACRTDPCIGSSGSCVPAPCCCEDSGRQNCSATVKKDASHWPSPQHSTWLAWSIVFPSLKIRRLKHRKVWLCSQRLVDNNWSISGYWSIHSFKYLLSIYHLKGFLPRMEQTVANNQTSYFSVELRNFGGREATKIR